MTLTMFVFYTFLTFTCCLLTYADTSCDSGSGSVSDSLQSTCNCRCYNESGIKILYFVDTSLQQRAVGSPYYALITTNPYEINATSICITNFVLIDIIGITSIIRFKLTTYENQSQIAEMVNEADVPNCPGAMYEVGKTDICNGCSKVEAYEYVIEEVCPTVLVVYVAIVGGGLPSYYRVVSNSTTVDQCCLDRARDVLIDQGCDPRQLIDVTYPGGSAPCVCSISGGYAVNYDSVNQQDCVNLPQDNICGLD